jgi:hypothetical protein
MLEAPRLSASVLSGGEEAGGGTELLLSDATSDMGPEDCVPVGACAGPVSEVRDCRKRLNESVTKPPLFLPWVS